MLKKFISIVSLFALQCAAQNTLSLSAWKASYGTAQTSTTNARVLFLGDSISYGQYTSSPPLTSFSSVFQSLSATRGYNAQQGLIMVSNYTDPRVSCGTGWTPNGYQGGYGPALSFGAYTSGTNTNACVITPTQTGFSVNSDRAYVYWTGAPGLGTLNATMTGGAAVNINESVTGGLYRTLVSAGSASTSNTISITTTGAAGFFGVEPFLSAKGQELIANTGYPGATTSDFTRVNTTNAPSTLLVDTNAFLALYQPSLTVIMLGTNDCYQGVPPQTTAQNIQQLVIEAKAYGNVVLLNQPPTNQSPTGQSCYAASLLPNLQSIAATNNIPLVDFNGFFGGSYSSSLMYDTTHPNTAGQWALGSFLFGKLWQ